MRDWSTGKFPRYATPSTSSSAAPDLSFASIYADDEKILATLSTRKELRKSRGLVKLTSAAVDSRQLDLDASWVESNEESDEDEDAEGEEDDEMDEMDADEDDVQMGEEIEDKEEGSSGEEDEEKEESEAASSPVGKRKRGIANDVVATRPTKKVAFSAEPTDTKQTRKVVGGRQSLAAKSRGAAPPTKSALRSTKPTLAPKKVANAGLSKKPAALRMSTTGEEEYDFKSFF